ncbi:MAG: ABC transporter ATP-binding protein [Clostridiales bacterium]|nr:ABC transporter ATP-binding protein [Clostridiales bacterium]
MNRGRGAGNGPAFAKPKEKTSVVLLKMWRYLAKYRLIIIAAALLSILGNALGLMSPKLSGEAIKAIELKSGVDFPVVIRYVLLMIAVAAASSLISWGLSAIMIRLSRNVVSKMRKDLFDHLTTLPISFFDTHQTGDVLSILSYDVDTVGATLSTDLTQIISSLVTVVGSFFMMVTLAPELLLVFAVTIPCSIAITRWRARIVRPLFSKRSRMLGAMNGYSEEAVSGLKTIRAYHQEDEFNDRFRTHNDNAVHATWHADHTAAVTGPTVNLINNLSLAAVSVFGALMYMSGRLLLGDVSSFVLYSRKFSGPINEFANILAEIQSSLAAAERVLTLLGLSPEPADDPDAQPIGQCRGRIEFRDVSFGYDEETTVLHHISYTAEPGKVMAIVGETGCGKTTMINLLMRFYDVTDGAILLDGVDLRKLPRDELRRQFTMVLQDTWLFDGTVFENIAYGRDGVTREDVERAAKAAHIHDMILSLPQGYDTIVTGSGNSISKGQKQLLTIARAMLIDSPMLILDEATSNVDTQTERRIQDAMLKLMHGRTCFIIAHRLSTITGADCILVMDKGRIVESGTHQELLDKRSMYYELYHAQFDRPNDAA